MRRLLRFFGRLKTELFYPRQWRATTIEQFIQVLDAYIRWYNEKRIKVSLGSPLSSINLMTAAATMTGAHGRTVEALPLSQLASVMTRYGRGPAS